MADDSVFKTVAGAIEAMNAELVAIRRDIHQHPELSWQEYRTTQLVAQRLEQAGVRTTLLEPTGVIADVGPKDAPTCIGLRGDMDALPMPETAEVEYRSTVPGASHACGHDVHTTCVLGAGLALQRHADVLDDLGLRVRLIFQPAEEIMPGGGKKLASSSALEGVQRVFALHCDPRRDVGEVGLRVGPITAASDAIRVHFSGTGGHTSRPHLTQDVTYAMAKVITDVPAALSRLLDPRVGAALVWGSVHAGSAPNVIPETGDLSGTLRMLDETAWHTVPTLLSDLITSVAAPYGAQVTVDYIQGVPPVVNDDAAVRALTTSCQEMVGESAVGPAEQSLGGEDFAWLLQRVPGAMGRLGTRTPGGASFDLHRGDLLIDEAAIAVGAKVMAGAALASAWCPAESAVAAAV